MKRFEINKCFLFTETVRRARPNSKSGNRIQIPIDFVTSITRKYH